MRALLALSAAVSLVAAAGACGSTITVPDQGVVVLGCAAPAACFKASAACSCTRAAAQLNGECTVAAMNCTPDNAECLCPESAGQDDGGVPIPVSCIETAAECVGRGVLCGMNDNCQPVGTTCGDPNVTHVPPQLVPPPGGASGPALEPHCPFTDDVCCPGPAVTDGGVTD